MGGDSNQNGDLMMKARTSKAAKVTAMQLAEAKQLHIQHFAGNDNPEILAAIIQALAINYAAVLQTSER